LIENNICFNNGMNGLTFQQTKNGIIRNNTVYANNAYPGDRIYGGLAINAGENIKVYNNLAVGSPEKPNLILYNVLGSPSNFQAEDNFKFRGTANSIYGSNVTDADPLLTNASIDGSIADFSLQQNSPLIDIGTTFDPVVDDFFGHARPIGNGNDAGAVEYSSNGIFTDAENNNNFWEDTLVTSIYHGEFSKSMNAPEIHFLPNGNIEILRFNEADWKVLNLNGQVLLSGKKENVINVNSLPKAIYIVEMEGYTYKITR